MNITRIPFSEIYERTQRELIRDKSADSDTEAKYMGFANDFYMTDMMLMLNEDYLRTEAFISTKADYSTGTVDISASGTTVGSGTTAPAWTSPNSNGFLFKENSNDLVARVTYTSATQLTFNNSLTWPHSAVDEGSYRLVLDRYALASDFSHMCMDSVEEPEVVYFPSGGGRAYLTPLEPGEYDSKFAFTHGTPGEYTVKYDAGVPYLHINPPDTTTRRIFYSYIPMLAPMIEYTTGYITTLAAAGTAVVGSGSAWATTTNIDTSAYTYYFRIDADGVGSKSKWYSVLSVTDATHLTLGEAYGGTAISSGTSVNTYTISRISRWPARFDTAIIYGTALKVDPNNTDVAKWKGILDGLIPLHRALDGRRITGQKLKVRGIR